MLSIESARDRLYQPGESQDALQAAGFPCGENPPDPAVTLLWEDDRCCSSPASSYFPAEIGSCSLRYRLIGSPLAGLHLDRRGSTKGFDERLVMKAALPSRSRRYPTSTAIGNDG